MFYFKNPNNLSIFLKKISTSFISQISINILLVMILIYLSLNIINYILVFSTYKAKFTIYIIAIGTIVSCYYILYHLDKNLLAIAVLIISLIPAFQLFRKKHYPLILPFPLSAVICNFIIFALVFYSCNEVYASRYVKTMEGITLLSILVVLDKIVKHFFKNNMLRSNK
jgi:hypothetical protein